MSEVVLIVAAHADDEVLGCAGTIAKHISQKDEVFTVFLADGVTSRENVTIAELEMRNIAANKSQRVLGIKKSYSLGFPDNRMDSIPLLDIVQKLETIINELQPKIIYTHHLGDLNIDHQVAHKAVMTACRPQPNFCVKKIYSFEVLSSTEWQTPSYLPFVPNVFVDISDYIDIKRHVLDIYNLEMRQPPHSRSVENSICLAKLRGASTGYSYAEAFIMIRELRD
ncbi:PIG-L family deacetylase [Acinetobacter sp. ANC 4216]|uniref:PIG-L deacetylase family protein n=1 Tax=Acinetobacter sp. ANC 4216 TaxID=2529840 RepID=UPI001038AC51|nr:PIG-L deacetylase family protein [Acinetobacter sp. ANC 4216]RZJ22735.1 MAG: PIG-L family deacetylase [Acinetobacter sp.]TCB72047.1 PIG-L family deacetylase [Acinetobacter sp. ANC 4216]